MGDAAVKESRRILRLVQNHLAQAHLNLGVEQESVGLVNVTFHPENKLPQLNYVSPRQKTAWVPGPEIAKGLKRLQELGRLPRVTYIEGLYPPLFAKSLRDLGLIVEREVPLMTYKPDVKQPLSYQPLPTGMSVSFPTTQDGIGTWWYVWRNAHYDVHTGGTDPVYIGRDMREIAMGNQIDIILHRFSFPVGVARLTTFGKTANINAIAVMKEIRSEDTLNLMYRIAVRAAADRGCELVFTTGQTEFERTVCRKLGFADSGSLVSYAQEQQQSEEKTDVVEEPIYLLR